MDPEIRIHGLDNRSLQSLLEHVKPEERQYVRAYESPGQVKRAVPTQTISFLFYSITLLSALASWLALRDKEVDMEASFGLTNKFRWRIKPGKRTAKDIQRELEERMAALRSREIQQGTNDKRVPASAGVKKQSVKQRTTRTRSSPKKGTTSKKTVSARKSAARKKTSR